MNLPPALLSQVLRAHCFGDESLNYFFLPPQPHITHTLVQKYNRPDSSTLTTSSTLEHRSACLIQKYVRGVLQRRVLSIVERPLKRKGVIDSSQNGASEGDAVLLIDDNFQKLTMEVVASSSSVAVDDLARSLASTAANTPSSASWMSDGTASSTETMKKMLLSDSDSSTSVSPLLQSFNSSRSSTQSSVNATSQSTLSPSKTKPRTPSSHLKSSASQHLGVIGQTSPPSPNSPAVEKSPSIRPTPPPSASSTSIRPSPPPISTAPVSAASSRPQPSGRSLSAIRKYASTPNSRRGSCTDLDVNSASSGGEGKTPSSASSRSFLQVSLTCADIPESPLNMDGGNASPLLVSLNGKSPLPASPLSASMSYLQSYPLTTPTATTFTSTSTAISSPCSLSLESRFFLHRTHLLHKYLVSPKNTSTTSSVDDTNNSSSNEKERERCLNLEERKWLKYELYHAKRKHAGGGGGGKKDECGNGSGNSSSKKEEKEGSEEKRPSSNLMRVRSLPGRGASDSAATTNHTNGENSDDDRCSECTLTPSTWKQAYASMIQIYKELSEKLKPSSATNHDSSTTTVTPVVTSFNAKSRRRRTVDSIIPNLVAVEKNTATSNATSAQNGGGGDITSPSFSSPTSPLAASASFSPPLLSSSIASVPSSVSVSSSQQRLPNNRIPTMMQQNGAAAVESESDSLPIPVIPSSSTQSSTISSSAVALLGSKARRRTIDAPSIIIPARVSQNVAVPLVTPSSGGINMHSTAPITRVHSNTVTTLKPLVHATSHHLQHHLHLQQQQSHQNGSSSMHSHVIHAAPMLSYSQHQHQYSHHSQQQQHHLLHPISPTLVPQSSSASPPSAHHTLLPTSSVTDWQRVKSIGRKTM